MSDSTSTGSINKDGSGLLAELIAAWMVIGVIGGVAAVVLRSNHPRARDWIDGNAGWLVLGAFLLGPLIAGLQRVPALRRVLAAMPASSKSAWSVFGLVPLIVFAVLAIAVVPEAWRAGLVHAIFIMVLCLLPAVMYYLFIISRRPSMLNEYVANLTRLGLIAVAPNDPEPESVRRRRIESYVQRFEAVYGTIADNRDQLLDELSKSEGERTQRSLGTVAYPAGRSLALTQVFPKEVLVQLLITTTLVAVGWFLVLPPTFPCLAPGVSFMEFLSGPSGEGPAPAPTGYTSVLVPILSPVNLAFVGAYFFSLQMIFRRFLRRDLTVKVYVNTCLRVVMAIVAAWVISIIGSMFAEGDVRARDLLEAGFGGERQVQASVLLLAFVVGVFPRTLWQVIASGLTKIPGLGLVLPSLHAGRELSELDGMTVWHEARLEEEDIENVANMATADPLELMLQTRIPPERLMQWIDEAILLTSLGNAPRDADKPSRRETLRQVGVTTATGLCVMVASAGSAAAPLLDERAQVASRQITTALGARASNFTLLRAWYRLRGDLVPTSTPAHSHTKCEIHDPELAASAREVARA